MAEPVGLSPDELTDRVDDLEDAMERALDLIARGKVDEAEDVLSEALGEDDEDDEDDDEALGEDDGDDDDDDEED